MDTLALNSWIFPLRYAQGQNDKVWRFFKENSQKIQGIYKEIQRKFKEFCGFCKKNSRNLRIFKNFSKKIKKFSLRIEKRQIVSQGRVRIYLFLKMSWVLGEFG